MSASRSRSRTKINTLYKSGGRSGNLYKRNHRRKRSSRSAEKTTTSAKQSKKNRYGFSKTLLIIAFSASAAYLVYSVVEAESIAGLLHQILTALRAALTGKSIE